MVCFQKEFLILWQQIIRICWPQGHTAAVTAMVAVVVEEVPTRVVVAVLFMEAWAMWQSWCRAAEMGAMAAWAG